MEERPSFAWKHGKAMLLWTWWMFFSRLANGQTCYYGEETSWIGVKTYEACATRVRVDSDNMLQFIRSVNETFLTYYAFYDVARDPLDSVPLEYGARFGYTVYNSTSAGKVDLAKDLDRIHLDVEHNGANLTTFWEVSKIFDRLLDEHVELNGKPFGAQGDMFGPSGFSFVSYLPPRIMEGTFAAARLDFKNNGTMDVMSLTWFNEDTEPMMVQEIHTINDMSPIEFLKFFTSIEGTTYEYAYKAQGSRINKLLNLNFGTISDQLLEREFYGNPAWFPPIQIVFTDGMTEAWEAYVKNLGVYNVTEIEERINTPGALYTTVRAVMDQAMVPVPMQTQKTNKFKIVARTDPSSRSYNKLAFQIGNGTSGAENFGVIAMEDYVVLKISTFDGVATETVVNAWNLAVDTARSGGIDKLILDLVQNSGGYIAAGYALMTCMFPAESYDTIAQTYNFVYSDLFRVMKEAVLPFLDEAETFTQQESNLVILIDGMGNADFSRILRISEAVDTLLGNEDSDLTNLAIQLNNTRTAANMAAYISGMLDILTYHNPVTAVRMDSAIGLPIQYAVRGGLNVALTGNTVIGFSEAEFNHVRESCQAGPFKKYAVLGDGTGGSTACIVSTFLQQTTPNGVNGPQVIAVSYGGTGDAEATPLTQYCGGSVIEPDLKDANIPLGFLFLLQVLLNTTAAGDLGAKAAATFEAYSQVLPSIPYFANIPMKMPVPMLYSKFMGPEAIPLEYINLPAQGYLRQWYVSTNFEALADTNATVRYGQKDLETLYNMSAAFYLTDDPVPPPPSSPNSPPSSPPPSSPPSPSGAPSVPDSQGTLELVLSIGVSVKLHSLFANH